MWLDALKSSGVEKGWEIRIFDGFDDGKSVTEFGERREKGDGTLIEGFSESGDFGEENFVGCESSEYVVVNESEEEMIRREREVKCWWRGNYGQVPDWIKLGSRVSG